MFDLFKVVAPPRVDFSDRLLGVGWGGVITLPVDHFDSDRKTFDQPTNRRSSKWHSANENEHFT